MVERHIATIKNMMNKIAEDDKKDLALALLEYRNTPKKKNLKSPNEIMFLRKIRGIIPNVISKQLIKQNAEIKKRLEDRQKLQKMYYDRNAQSDMSPVKSNDPAFVKKELNKPPVPAKIIKCCDRPRSYKLELENKSLIERNRKHIYGPITKENEIKNQTVI